MTDPRSNPANLVFRLRRTDVPNAAEMPLREGVNSVGRDTGSNLVLDVPEVSRKHAEVRVSGPTVTVTDLHSANGTFVNGERVSEAELRAGDRIRFGSATFE